MAVPYVASTGIPTDPTTPDTEVSVDAAAFGDCTEEVTTISGSNGFGYLTLTGAETNGSLIVLAAKVASGPNTTLATIMPRVLATVGSGTLSAGSAGGGTLGTLLAYDVTGCFLRTTGGTGGGGTGGANNQARKIVTYVTTTGVFTVAPNWETTPDATTTYDVLLPEGVTLGMLRTLNPTTAGRTLTVDASGNGNAVLANAVSHGGTTATLRLGGSTSTPAFYVTNSGGGAVKFESTGGGGHGLAILGQGAGYGIDVHSGATGRGISVTATDPALYLDSALDGAFLTGANSGITIFGGARGVDITGGVDAATIIAGTITGSLTGSVGSVDDNVIAVLADGVAHGGSTASLRLGSSTDPGFYVTSSATSAVKFEALTSGAGLETLGGPSGGAGFAPTAQLGGSTAIEAVGGSSGGYGFYASGGSGGIVAICQSNGAALDLRASNDTGISIAAGSLGVSINSDGEGVKIAASSGLALELVSFDQGCVSVLGAGTGPVVKIGDGFTGGIGLQVIGNSGFNAVSATTTGANAISIEAVTSGSAVLLVSDADPALYVFSTNAIALVIQSDNFGGVNIIASDGIAVSINAASGIWISTTAGDAIYLNPTDGNGITIDADINANPGASGIDIQGAGTGKDVILSGDSVLSANLTGVTASLLAQFFSTNSGTTYASAVAGSVVKEIASNASGSSVPTVVQIRQEMDNNSTKLDVAVGTRMATYTQPTGFLAATFPATVASTTNITAGIITTATNLTNAPTVGDLTSAMKASVNAEVDTALADYDAPTNAEMVARTLPAADYGTAVNQTTIMNRIGAFTATGVNTVLGFFKALLSKTATTPSDVGGTFDPVTDSTEAIRDRGDAAWVTATGFSTLDAAGVRSAVGLATANLDGQLLAIAGYVDTEMSAALAAALAVQAVTDKLDTALELDGSVYRFTTNALELSPTGGSAPTATEIADTLLGRNLAGGSDGGRTVQDALRALRNKVTRPDSAGVGTVYMEDDTTPAWTFAITVSAGATTVVDIDPE